MPRVQSTQLHTGVRQGKSSSIHFFQGKNAGSGCQNVQTAREQYSQSCAQSPHRKGSPANTCSCKNSPARRLQFEADQEPVLSLRAANINLEAGEYGAPEMLITIPQIRIMNDGTQSKAPAPVQYQIQTRLHDNYFYVWRSDGDFKELDRKMRTIFPKLQFNDVFSDFSFHAQQHHTMLQSRYEEYLQ